jgi:hypothetical protein
MGFEDWVTETAETFRSEPPRAAAVKSSMNFARGVVERVEGAGFTMGRNIYEDEWDVCAILDACRHDLYEEVRGSTPSEWSIAAKSGTFVARTFDEETAAETVYVSANPNAKDAKDLPWKAFVELWDRGWDDELQTVPPREVTCYGLAARERYPNARIVLHYMQPHHPFTPAGHNLGGTWAAEDLVWNRLEAGEVDEEEVWTAYRKNLEVVLEDVDLLSEALDEERILVTADHGNALGEYGMYGHPGGMFVPATRRVPWVFEETGARSSVDVDTDVGDLENEDIPDDLVEERLESLGYK